MRKNINCIGLCLAALLGTTSCGASMSRTDRTPYETPSEMDAATFNKPTDADTQSEAKVTAEEIPIKERDLGKGGDKEPLGDDNKQERDLGKGADTEPTPSSP